MAGSARSRRPEARIPHADELGLLPGIEQRAGELLRDHEAYRVFTGHGLDLATLQYGLERGQLWVVDAAGGGIAGYVLAGELAGSMCCRWMWILHTGGKAMAARCCAMRWHRPGPTATRQRC